MKIFSQDPATASAMKQSRASLLVRSLFQRDQARSRRALSHMDPHLLKDMGLTPASSATRIPESWWIA